MRAHDLAAVILDLLIGLERRLWSERIRATAEVRHAYLRAREQVVDPIRSVADVVGKFRIAKSERMRECSARPIGANAVCYRIVRVEECRIVRKRIRRSVIIVVVDSVEHLQIAGSVPVEPSERNYLFERSTRYATQCREVRQADGRCQVLFHSFRVSEPEQFV